MVAWTEIEESLRRGVSISRERLSDLTERIVSDTERVRLRFELRKIDKKINECYRIIGENAFEKILKGEDLTKDKELKRSFNEVNNLLLERERIEGERDR